MLRSKISVRETKNSGNYLFFTHYVSVATTVEEFFKEHKKYLTQVIKLQDFSANLDKLGHCSFGSWLRFLSRSQHRRMPHFGKYSGKFAFHRHKWQSKPQSLSRLPQLKFVVTLALILDRFPHQTSRHLGILNKVRKYAQELMTNKVLFIWIELRLPLR